MYITRNIEETIKRISGQFRVLLLTGARQVGKTTLLKHLAGNNRTYVTLDDLAVRSLALSDPALFLQRYTPPLLIDEIQYAPQLLSYIKIYADTEGQNGDIWLTGSQRLPLMQGVTESLAGRVGVVDLQGLTAGEINGNSYGAPFLPNSEQLLYRVNHTRKQSLKEIYKLIWQGSMPALYNGGEQDWQSYYASYVQTFLQRDVMKLLQVNDEMLYFRFLCAAAGQTGKMINYAELAKAAEVSAPTAKQWIKILEAAGIIYLLQPFMPPGSKYIVKAPKLYFFDTGLAAYLTRWTNAEALEMGAMSGEFFETWAVTEIYKSYANKGITPPLYYLKNFNGKEIELIIYENGTAYPVAIKKSAYPQKAVKTFGILEPVKNDAKIQIGEGGIICFADDLLPAAEGLWYIPAWLV
ncbi:MAG: ATPase [Phascolarctobacterium sp.]|nr:MAG: ATPase [Phascolarctobacterium sp.]